MTQGAFRGFLIFTVCVSSACIALGIWQLQRHEWKSKQLEEAEATASAPAVPMPFGQPPVLAPYTRLNLMGKFLPAHDIVIRGFSLKGVSGSRLYAPFELTDGRVIIVQRGWTSRGNEDTNGVIDQSLQQIEVIWRRVQPRTSGNALFQSVNIPEQDLWTHIDPSQLAKWWDLPTLILGGYGELRTPAEAAEKLMIEEFNSNLSNRHLEYVATWWSLAAALMGIFGLIWRDQRRNSRFGIGQKKLEDIGEKP